MLGNRPEEIRVGVSPTEERQTIRSTSYEFDRRQYHMWSERASYLEYEWRVKARQGDFNYEDSCELATKITEARMHADTWRKKARSKRPPTTVVRLPRPRIYYNPELLIPPTDNSATTLSVDIKQAKEWFNQSQLLESSWRSVASNRSQGKDSVQAKQIADAFIDAKRNSDIWVARAKTKLDESYDPRERESERERRWIHWSHIKTMIGLTARPRPRRTHSDSSWQDADEANAESLQQADERPRSR